MGQLQSATKDFQIVKRVLGRCMHDIVIIDQQQTPCPPCRHVTDLAVIFDYIKYVVISGCFH
ncbi:hypothetical protein [Azospirillum palustre]